MIRARPGGKSAGIRMVCLPSHERERPSPTVQPSAIFEYATTPPYDRLNQPQNSPGLKMECSVKPAALLLTLTRTCRCDATTSVMVSDGLKFFSLILKTSPPESATSSCFDKGLS